MAIPGFDIGEQVRLSVAFTDIVDQPDDPSIVTLRVLLPDGTEEEFSGGDITNDSETVGGFYYDYEITMAGDYHWRWIADGTLVAADEGVFAVHASPFP